MAEERPTFPVVKRGYDPAAVDERIHTLEESLTKAREHVWRLDQRTMTIEGQLSEAQRQLRETERPTYAGLGSRIEQLLRSAEEQSTEVLSRSNAQAREVVDRAERIAA